MLGKLIKYEIRATARLFLPFYGALVLFAILNKVFFSFKTKMPDLFMELTLSIFVMIIVAIFVLTFIVMIQRFYKNLLCDEGYLMFTLPVKSWQHITSKLLVALLWIVLSIAVTLLTIAIMLFNSQMIPFMVDAIRDFTFEVSLSNKTSFLIFLVRMLISGLLSSLCTILMIYLSIAIGHLFGKHRILASFGAFLGITFAMQSSTSILVLYVFKPLIEKIEEFQTSFTVINHALMTLLNVSDILNLIFSAIFFFITSYILQKKLNLD